MWLDDPSQNKYPTDTKIPHRQYFNPQHLERLSRLLQRTLIYIATDFFIRFPIYRQSAQRAQVLKAMITTNSTFRPTNFWKDLSHQRASDQASKDTRTPSTGLFVLFFPRINSFGMQASFGLVFFLSFFLSVFFSLLLILLLAPNKG